MRRILHRVGVTSIEILVLLGIVAVLVSVLVPAVQSSREAASRAEYDGNLKIRTLATSSQVAVGSLLPARFQSPGNLQGAGPVENRGVLLGRDLSIKETSPGDTGNAAQWAGDALDLTCAGLGVTRFRSFHEPTVLELAALESLPGAASNTPRFDEPSDSLLDLLTRARDPQWPSEDFLDASASSFHPGGANFAFCDGGSVRFIKETINSWTADSSTAVPQGANSDSLNRTCNIATGSKTGIYRALCSSRLGAIVPDDKY